MKIKWICGFKFKGFERQKAKDVEIEDLEIWAGLEINRVAEGRRDDTQTPRG